MLICTLSFFKIITFSSCFCYKTLHQFYLAKMFHGFNMEYDIEPGKQLVNELLDLWTECISRCDKIEERVKQLKVSEKKR